MKRLKEYIEKWLDGQKVRGIQVSLLDIREDTNGFIRWNCVTNKFEWFKRSE